MTYFSLILSKISISVISALGLYLSTTLCGQLSLGSAGFMSLGAYILAFFGTATGVAAAPIAVFVTTLALGFVLLRLSGDYLAAATLGISELVRIALTNLSLLGGAGGYTLTLRIPPSTAVFSAAAVLVFTALLAKSRLGHLCRATAIDETAALACGVDTLKLKTLMFAASCATCAFSGCLYAGSIGFISPNDFGFTRSCETLAAVIIGGKNPIAVAACATALELLSVLLVGFSERKMLAYAAALLACCYIRRNRHA